MKVSLRCISFGCLTLLCLPEICLAYLDPGSGSMLAQLVLGGIAGLLVLLQVLWGKIKSYLAVWGRRLLPWR